MITANLHNPTVAIARRCGNFSYVQIEDEAGNSVSLLFETHVPHAVAEAIADACKPALAVPK